MGCQKCGGVQFLKEDKGNWKKFQCVRCGDEVMVFRNALSKELYEENLKKGKEQKPKKIIAEKLWKLFMKDLIKK